MRIKRFEAIDTMTALAKVKEELGEDAIILSTRTIPAGRKNGTGRNGRPVVEMVAAMDYDQELLTVPPPGEDAPMEARSFAALNSYQSRPREVAGKNGAPGATRPGRIHPQLEPDKNEGSELRLRLAGYLKRQFDAKTRLEQAGPLRNDPHAETPSGKKKPGPAEVAQWRDRIIDKLQAQPISSGRTGAAPTIVALVGPTGVGKTTTAAKIAAWFSIHEKKRTALISTDCYRIGGTDQLRTYAKIMRLPCEIALGKNDLNLAIRRHQDKDLIIIDTAGKSPYDPNHIRELTEWFSAYEVKTHLVLSATAKKEDLLQIINTYAPLALSGLVLAKLDETRAYASLCQLLAASGLPISCLCTGQRVPEDFLLASKDFMRTLFGKGWQMALKQFQENSTGQWPQ